MFRFWIVSLAFLIPSASSLTAQSTQTAPLEYQITPTQAWTDTGLDLQSGDVVEISATSSISAEKHTASNTPVCDPAGLSGASSSGSLPLPSAAPGALIARLKQGAAPVLVGANNEVHINEPSHLFLGMNISGAPPCQGGFTVKVQKNAAGSAQSRGAQLKAQLGNAAEIFMHGQFGINKPTAGASGAASTTTTTGGATSTTPAPTLKVSDAPLDAGLRKDLDSLPRRVNDQFNNLGDMVNFVIVGSQKDVQAALDAATWHVADTSNTNAVFNAVMQTYGNKDYLAMPMSILYLFGRKQDFGYEMAEPIAMVASRHHFRVWKAPFTWNGQEVWVGAGTHDIGFAKDKRNNNVTHKIDPAVDGERDNIGSSLQKANKAKTLTYYLPPNPVQEAKNATGDTYHSDGRLLVVFLQ